MAVPPLLFKKDKVIFLRSTKASVKSGSGKSKGMSTDQAGYFFILPFFIVFLIFSIYPVIRTFYLSFTSYKGFGEPVFTGTANYVRVAGDPLFWQAFVNTLKMWGLNIVLQLGTALILTIVFNDIKYRMKGLSLFRALFYLPNLIACTSVAFLFKTLLDWKFGTFNQILMGMGLIDKSVNWLVGKPATAQVVVAVIGAWMWFGNSFILLMAGVQGINKDYFEAATIDGAGRWNIFARITMPLLKPIMLYVAITSLIGGLQLFDIPFLISGGEGKPDRALNTVVMYLYNMAFKNHQMGYAAAIAFVLFFIIVIFSIVSFKAMYGKKEK